MSTEMSSLARTYICLAKREGFATGKYFFRFVIDRSLVFCRDCVSGRALPSARPHADCLVSVCCTLSVVFTLAVDCVFSMFLAPPFHFVRVEAAYELPLCHL